MPSFYPQPPYRLRSQYNTASRKVNMTFQEMVAEIRQLTIQERLSLIEALTRSVQAELDVDTPAMPTLEPLRGVLNPEGSSLVRVRGMAKPDGPTPTDQEIRDMRDQYLIEKYT